VGLGGKGGLGHICGQTSTTSVSGDREIKSWPCSWVQGNEHGHLGLRKEVVGFISGHPEDFAPYMEDEEDFDKYCDRMAKVPSTPRTTGRSSITRTTMIGMFGKMHTGLVREQCSEWKMSCDVVAVGI